MGEGQGDGEGGGVSSRLEMAGRVGGRDRDGE